VQIQRYIECPDVGGWLVGSEPMLSALPRTGGVFIRLN